VAGQATAGVVSARVAALAEGVMKTMFLSKLKKVMALLLIVAVAGAGATGVAMQGEPAVTAPPLATKTDEPRKQISASRFLKGEYRFLSMGFDRGARALATVTMDAASEPGDVRAKNAVRLWDLQSGSVARTLAEDWIKDRYYHTYAGVCLSPDGETVAVAVDGNFAEEGGFFVGFVLWDAKTGKIRHKLKHGLEVRALAFSPQGQIVASRSGCGGAEGDFESVKLWDVKTGRLRRTLKTRDLEAVKFAFSPDGKLLAVVHDPVLDHSRGSAEVTLWDTAAGKWSQALPDSEGLEVIGFSSDGKALLGAARTKLLAWDVATAKTIQKSELTTTKTRTALTFSPDGKTLAVAEKQDVALYDVKTAKPTHILKGGHGLIGPLAFSPDGKTLAGASSDRTIYLWDFELPKDDKEKGRRLE
jgi:WD40 repeat protein